MKRSKVNYREISSDFSEKLLGNIESPVLSCDVIETPIFRLERETSTLYVDAEIFNSSAVNAAVRIMVIQMPSHTVDVNPSVFQLKAVSDVMKFRGNFAVMGSMICDLENREVPENF